jgi:uncharacterized protein involved in outer membrane biogenesis
VTLKRAMVSILALLGVVLVIAAGAAAWLLTADLKPRIESYASKAIQRRVSIGTLRIGWGNPLSIELTDLKIANAPWGSVPDMIAVKSVSAVVDPWSLLGAPTFQKLHAAKPVIVLERDKDGTGNWNFSGPVDPSPGDPPGPQDRAQFPTLLDFEMKDGMLSYKGLSSYRLRLDLHEASIRTSGSSQPVKLLADGAYNGTPVKLSAETDSFDVFHDTSRPLGAKLSLFAASTKLEFAGTIVDPLNFEGVDGPATIDSGNLGELVKVFGVAIAITPPLAAAGQLQHRGDHWELKGSKGKIATSAFAGDLTFDEGPRGGSDDLTARLSFEDLDLGAVLAGAEKSSAPADVMATSLRLDPNRGVNIDLDATIKRLAYGKSRIADFGLDAKLTSGAAALRRLNLAFAGGRIDASGSAVSTPGGTHVMERGTLTGADAAQLTRYVDALSGKLTGQVDGGFDMDMTGDTLGGALKAGHGHAVLGLARGSVSRDLMEKLSTNLLNLFRSGEGSTSVSCLLGIVDLRGGVAAISPLRLRSRAGTLIGGGQVDILDKRLDVTIQSEASTTGFFALNIPIRISGSFANPNIDPRLGGGALSRQALVNNNPTRGLSAELRAMAERNTCLH